MLSLLKEYIGKVFREEVDEKKWHRKNRIMRRWLRFWFLKLLFEHRSLGQPGEARGHPFSVKRSNAGGRGRSRCHPGSQARTPGADGLRGAGPAGSGRRGAGRRVWLGRRAGPAPLGLPVP